ncbi:MAG: response regulator [Defluviitaleaceae bacterium]|nr:response regulator [Defluviitaleaceae bacterium]
MRDIKTIFIVDDNDVNRITARNALDGTYIPYAIPSAEQMLKLAERITPDLILLDVEMPDMNGYEALEILKQNEKLSKIPVIFLTGKNDPESEMKGFELGAVDFINKPFSAPVLIKRIESHLENIRLINEINDSKKAAEEANMAKSKFLATMSHEIRTPLNAIIGISEIELEREDINGDIKNSFNRIFSSGHMLLGIINDILDLSKIETGKLELVPANYKTTHLINDTIHLNAMRIDDKPIDFRVTVAETLPLYLYGDELRIKQVLNNLLSNAIKYTDKGTVTFEVYSQERDDGDIFLVFTISDTGQGMTQEQLNTLYEEYSQFNRDVNRATEGTGLGMNITKNLVDMMDGKIIGKSKPGVGSTFTVYLTQKPVSNEILGADIAESLESFKFAGKVQRTRIDREYMPYGRVFVIDDVEANVFVASALLKPYGLHVDTAASGYTAVNKIRNGSEYDIIFMDHMMPGMDGVEATKIIRDMGYDKPIIALTANAVIGQMEIFIENGFDDFISKPINIQQLDDILNKLIRDRKPIETVRAARAQKKADTHTVTENSVSSKPLDLIRGIEDIHADAALELMGGNADAYVQTVRLFARLTPETLEKTDKYIEGDDLKAFTIEIHGIKGAMRNIGANKTGNHAARLETAGIRNDIGYIKEHYPIFRKLINVLLDDLKEIFTITDAGEKETADLSALTAVLSRLKESLQEYDCVSVLELLKPYIDFSYGEAADALLLGIRHALESFDNKSALEIINKLESLQES